MSEKIKYILQRASDWGGKSDQPHKDTYQEDFILSDASGNIAGKKCTRWCIDLTGDELVALIRELGPCVVEFPCDKGSIAEMGAPISTVLADDECTPVITIYDDYID